TSPCVRNCCLDDDNICMGCFRSMDEILQWRDASGQQQKEILKAAKIRKAAHQLKYKSASTPDNQNKYSNKN
ncbi:hypothetical protein A9Q78_00005, partial [Methylophaga sp. 41_12_T18]